MAYLKVLTPEWVRRHLYPTLLLIFTCLFIGVNDSIIEGNQGFVGQIWRKTLKTKQILAPAAVG